jgi:lysine 2,3-aminomutase
VGIAALMSDQQLNLEPKQLPREDRRYFRMEQAQKAVETAAALEAAEKQTQG